MTHSLLWPVLAGVGVAVFAVVAMYASARLAQWQIDRWERTPDDAAVMQEQEADEDA
jgi:xanthine/uracil permease